jgi:hypothetical protein
MEISPPFGYPAITVLEKNQHVVLPRPGEDPEFCRKSNALPISYSEFSHASHDYPLMFISGDGGKTFAAVAALGLQTGQNLFVDAAGAWDKSVYVPAYVRRYPFCMAQVSVDGAASGERVVCVAQQAIDEENGEQLFDDKGEALPHWTDMEKLLHEYEVDLMRTQEMCGILKEYDLLEPFTMQAVPNAGGAMQLTGMYRVAESRLAALEAEQLRALIEKGVMGRIYTHLLSLNNFERLLGRVGAAASAAQAA